METNKILGAIILALLLAAVFSKVADMAIHPEFPDELAYKIEIPEGGVTTSVSEDVDIFAVLPDITPMLASASMENGEKIFKKCASCHTHVKGGENKTGPAMWGIVNREKGSSEGFRIFWSTCSIWWRLECGRTQQILIKAKKIYCWHKNELQRD